jgi:chromosomal replication initiation ATPase DnaA
MRIQAAGMDLSGVIAAVCRYLNIDEKELISPTRRFKITRARSLVSYIETRGLSISGSEVAIKSWVLGRDEW